jgi:hypothetical protein
MPTDDYKRIAESWLTVQRHWWAWEAIREVCDSNPREALAIILVLVDQADTAELIETVGAGPLEDLLENHGAAVIDAVESSARDNPSFRTALAHVWLTESAGSGAVGERLVALGCRVVPVRSAGDV